MTLSEFQRTAIIAVLFVIGIVTLAFLGISLFTAPQSHTTTQFNVTTTENRIIITHTGGEPLKCELLTFHLNGKEIDTSSGSLTSCPWSIGNTVEIPYVPSGIIQTIRIFYHEEKGPVELFFAEIEPETPIPIMTETQAPTPTTVHPTLIATPTHIPIQGSPVASFDASPRIGPVPFTVRFIDSSSGVPEEWAWLFGDGATSTVQNPEHTYTREGSYPVSLTVKNGFGVHTRISQGYVTVTPAEAKDLALEAGLNSAISPGGFIEFSVAQPGSSIKIGGQAINLIQGDRIRLVLDSGGRGKISIRNGAILAFSFDRVAMMVNGKETISGTVREINIRGYDDVLSTLDLVVERGDGDLKILERGVPVDPSIYDSGIVLRSLRPDSSGTMTLDCSGPARTAFQGCVTSYDPL